MNTTLQTLANLLQPSRVGFPSPFVDAIGNAFATVLLPGRMAFTWFSKSDDTMPDMLVFFDDRKSDSMYPSQELPDPPAMLFPIPACEGMVADACGLPSRYTFLPGKVYCEGFGGGPHIFHPQFLPDVRSSHALYR